MSYELYDSINIIYFSVEFHIVVDACLSCVACSMKILGTFVRALWLDKCNGTFS